MFKCYFEIVKQISESREQSGFRNTFCRKKRLHERRQFLVLRDFIETPDQDYCINYIANKKAYGEAHSIISEKESIKHDDSDKKYNFERIKNQEQIDKTCIIRMNNAKFCIKHYQVYHGKEQDNKGGHW